MSGLTFDTLDTPIEQALEDLIEATEELVRQANLSLDMRSPFRVAVVIADNTARVARQRLQEDA